MKILTEAMSIILCLPNENDIMITQDVIVEDGYDT